MKPHRGGRLQAAPGGTRRARPFGRAIAIVAAVMAGPKGPALLCVALTVAAVSAAQTPRTNWDGVYTSAQADRGQKVYTEYCGRCHGDGLNGVESAPPLTGSEFAGNWEGTPLGDLFERMRMSMPQDKPGSLSRAQNADILAYMLKVGGFPAGAQELDGQPGALATITFRLYKP
jgi:mono/diheme cytochrome c family protein